MVDKGSQGLQSIQYWLNGSVSNASSRALARNLSRTLVGSQTWIPVQQPPFVNGQPPARTAEESARHAVFWALFEVEHAIGQYVKLLQAGEDVRIRLGVYKYEKRQVEIGLRIEDHITITGGP